jgi:hypothetical protein
MLDLFRQIAVTPAASIRVVRLGLDAGLTPAQIVARRQNIALARKVSADRRRLPVDERKRRQRAAMARYRLRKRADGVLRGFA